MSNSQNQERRIKFLEGITVDGAPMAYIMILAGLIIVLSFFPFSIVYASGGSFPVAEGLFPLVGWLLGPIAGALTTFIGRAIGIIVAPRTAGVALVSLWSATLGSFAAGAMVTEGKRSRWWIPLTVIFSIKLLLFAGRAMVQHGISPWAAIVGSLLDWSGVLLFALPTRTMIARWLKQENLGLVILGLFLGTWIVSGVIHVSSAVFTYYMFNWSEDIWIALIPIIPVETLYRCIIGTVFGTAIISVARAYNLQKPTAAVY